MKQKTNSPQILWRYMSLAKFIDLLSTKSIYCCRADLFEDKTEAEWFSQIAINVNRSINAHWKYCYEAIQRLNHAIASREMRTVEDIREILYKTLSAEEISALDISDDMSQITSDGFFDSIAERLDCIAELEASYRDMIVDSASEDFERNRSKIALIKRRAYISSWFADTDHSMAMWKAYGQAEGIAIVTTQEKLNALINGQPAFPFYKEAECLCANVVYVNESEENTFPDIYRALTDGAWLTFRDLLFKHTAFQYEKEHRLMVLLPENEKESPSGIKVPIRSGLNHFIDKIYLNPSVCRTHWFVGVVQDVLSKYNIDKNKLNYSEIRTEYS